MDLGTLVGVSNVVELRQFAMLFVPGLLLGEEGVRHWPRHELDELHEVLAEVSNDNFVVHEIVVIDLLLS